MHNPTSSELVSSCKRLHLPREGGGRKFYIRSGPQKHGHTLFRGKCRSLELNPRFGTHLRWELSVAQTSNSPTVTEHLTPHSEESVSTSSTGTLFRYGKRSAQVAFQSGAHPSQVVYIGGMDEGLIGVPYIPSLASSLDDQGWSLVQAQISSSYLGYGVGSLDRDAKELAMLAAHLKAERGCQRIVIIGHSTGCQDVVRYVKRNLSDTDLPPLAGAVLQAPVSDQEDGEMYPEMKKYEAAALEMVSQGKGEEIVMRDFITIPAGAPICARRFLDLFKRGGDDDMFSSYFTEKEMQDVLQHMAPVPCLVLMSGKDEYVPQSIDTRVLGERISQAIGPNAISRVIEGGLHSLNGNEDEAVSVLTEFIKSLGSTPEMNGS